MKKNKQKELTIISGNLFDDEQVELSNNQSKEETIQIEKNSRSVKKEKKKTIFRRYYMRKFDNLSIEEAIDFLFNVKELREDAKNIFPYSQMQLSSGGANINENYQIFTPEFIVRDMINAIGIEEVKNFERTIFEPTSGDGAFTTYILKLRLEEAIKDKENYYANVLKSISTIYSVEMDKELIFKQRNNIYTLVINFSKENNLPLNYKEESFLKYIVATNFIWGMTNIDNPVYSIFSSEVVYKMPVKDKNYEAIEFPVWNFTDDLMISLHYEGVE